MRELFKIVFEAKGQEVTKANIGALTTRIMADFDVMEIRITRREVVAFVFKDDGRPFGYEARCIAIDDWWNHGSPATTEAV